MTAPTTVFLVDDEPKAIETHTKAINGFLEQVSVVGSATTVDEAHEKILSVQPDLVLLDIEMGTGSGFQLLEKFEQIDFQVAFVTAHEAYALKAIKFSAIDYIVKPASIDDLRALVAKVEKRKASESRNDSGDRVSQMLGNIFTPDRGEHKLTLAIADGYEFVKVNDILYLKADGSYTHFTLQGGEHIVTSKNLKFFEGLLDEYGFFRIHNSTLINTKFIKRLIKSAGGSVVMENGEEFSISKSRKQEFMSHLALR